jgi:hypothetical protein
MTILDLKKLDNAIFIALNRVYGKAFFERTPKKTGGTAQKWEIERVKPFYYQIINPFGDIITFLEFGTEPHEIKPKNKKALRWVDGGKEHFAKKVNHPGFEARRFVQGILNDNALYNKFKQELAQRIKL